MSTKIEFNVKDEDLKQVLDNNPFLINISGAVNMCMIRCGQEIDNCNSVKIETMTNYGNILVLNPSINNDIKCNIKLPYDSVGDNNSNYKFNKIFFTVPSLHRINNTIYDMETFIVFSSKQKDGSTLKLVLCTLLSGIDNVNSGDWKLLNYKLMNELFSEKNTVPEVYGTTAINLVPNPVDLNTFIPSVGNRSFYDYTHPQNTKTNIRVFQTPMSVSNNILSILKNKLTPGTKYNNNKNIIQQSINPSSGLFLYYSEDLTDRYKNFSINKGFEYKEDSIKTLTKAPVINNVKNKISNSKGKSKSSKKKSMVSSKDIKKSNAKIKKAFSKKEINKDKAKIKKAFSKKEIAKDKAKVEKAFSKKEIAKDKAKINKAFSKKEIAKDKAKINKAFKGKSKKEKFTNYNDSDDDIEDYENEDSDDIENYENEDSDDTENYENENEDSDDIEDYENENEDSDDTENYENENSDDTENYENEDDIEDYENEDSDDIEDYENEDSDENIKDDKNIEEYAVYKKTDNSQKDHKNIVGVMLNTIFTLIIVYFFYYILYNIANNPELKNQVQKLVTPSELNDFMNNNPNFKISSYCKMGFYTLFGLCVVLSIIMIFFLILFFTNKSRYLIISSTTLLSFINVFIIGVYISMFGYFIYRVKSNIYDINIKDYDLTTIDVWKYIKNNFSKNENTTNIINTNLNNMNGGNNIGELPPGNNNININNNDNKDNNFFDNIDNLINSLNFKWVYIYLFFVIISIIILTVLLNIANISVNVSDKVKYLAQTSVSMNRFIIGVFYAIFFLVLIFWDIGIIRSIRNNYSTMSYIENKNYKNIIYNFITNSVIIMILIYITGYFGNITRKLNKDIDKKTSYFYSSMQAVFIIILIILFIYIFGGYYYIYTILKNLFNDTTKIYSAFMLIIFLLIVCFIITLPSIILSHQYNLKNSKMPLIGLFSSYAVFGVILFIWYKYLPKNNSI